MLQKWEDFCIALRRDFHESLNCPGRKLKQLLVFVLSYVLWDSLPSKCKMVVF